MKISKLITYLEDLKKKYGDQEIDILTETTYSHKELIEVVTTFDEMLDKGMGSGLQVEQPLGDVAYCSGDKRVKLLPEGF
jgi:hypothetical protein